MGAATKGGRLLIPAILDVATYTSVVLGRPIAPEDAHATDLAAVPALRGQWLERSILNVPGPVYVCESDTTLFGVETAPENVACDEWGREFLFRQPRSASELRAVWDAASNEPFFAYGFDGMTHLQVSDVDWWFDQRHVVEGYLRDCMNRQPTSDLVSVWTRCLHYLSSVELQQYRRQLMEYLAARH